MGKPNPGTPKDRRLKENKGSKRRKGTARKRARVKRRIA